MLVPFITLVLFLSCSKENLKVAEDINAVCNWKRAVPGCLRPLRLDRLATEGASSQSFLSALATNYDHLKTTLPFSNHSLLIHNGGKSFVMIYNALPARMLQQRCDENLERRGQLGSLAEIFPLL